MGCPSMTTAGMPRPIEDLESSTLGLAGLRLCSEPGLSEPILKGFGVGAPKATAERKERTTADLIVLSWRYSQKKQ